MISKEKRCCNLSKIRAYRADRNGAVPTHDYIHHFPLDDAVERMIDELGLHGAIEKALFYASYLISS